MDNSNENAKIKITYIVPKFYPFKAGAEMNIETMAERMVLAGNDVTVLTSDFKFRDTDLSKYEEYKGIKIHRHKSFIQNPSYLFFSPSIFWRILKNDADVIHVSGFGFILFEFALTIKKINNKFRRWFFKKIKKQENFKGYKTKFVNTPHGPFMAFSASKKEGRIRRISRSIYTKYLSILIPRLYEKVIAVVPRQKEWMTSLYKIREESIAVIPNGIDAEYVEEVVPKYKKGDKVVITYLNRMNWYKGIQTVLEAINKLNREERYRESRKDLKHKPLPKFEFLIMGKASEYTKTLKRMIDEFEINDQVEFIYTPTDQERDEKYLASQINILPSKWEATGIVLIEAMAKGKCYYYNISK
ncbi:MAG: glycosyltransferase family 4 protein [Candidatus Dojkabacteria bacterium]|nr:glycosyltransferase family 4 protein [Candidatus Dojkabacteria bacterium]